MNFNLPEVNTILEIWIFKLYIFKGLISQENTLNFTKGIIKNVGRWMTLFELSFQLETMKGESIILSGLLLHLRMSVVVLLFLAHVNETGWPKLCTSPRAVYFDDWPALSWQNIPSGECAHPKLRWMLSVD